MERGILEGDVFRKMIGEDWQESKKEEMGEK